MAEYELADDDRLAWKQLVKPYFPHGTQKRSAAILGDLPPVPNDSPELMHPDPGSWSTLVSQFCNGRNPGLNALLRRQPVLEALAEFVREDEPPDFVALYHRARGQRLVRRDAAFVPGLEHLGPVPAADLFVEPTGVGGGASGGRFRIEDFLPDSRLSPAKISVFIGAHLAEGGFGLAVTGEPGTGKTLFLKALSDQLRRDHVATLWWEREPSPEARVLLCDAVDQLAAADAAQLRQLIQEGHVVVATGVNEKAVGRIAGHCKARLPPITEQHARSVTIRVGEVAAQTWRRKLDTERIVRWLDREPLAAHRLERVDLIGMHVREATEGAAVPIALDALVSGALRRLRELLDAKGRGSDAGLVADVAALVLEDLAVAAAQSPDGTVNVTSFLGHVSATYARHHTLGSGKTARRILDCLMEGGLVARRDEVATIEEGYIRRGLLARALNRQLEAEEAADALLRAIAEQQDADRILIGAAELAGDSSEILRALLALPSAYTTQLVAEITQLLSSHILCQDAALARDTLALLVSWWARTYETPLRRDDYKRLWIGRTTVFERMALASYRHRHVVETVLTTDELAQPSLWRDEFTAYHAARGDTEPSLRRLRLARLLLVPAHAPVDDIRKARSLAAALFYREAKNDRPGYWQFIDGYKGWWRVLDRLSREQGARALALRNVIAGVCEGDWVGHFIPPNFYGDVDWATAIAAVAQDRTPISRRVVGDAILAVVYVPYSRNVEGLGKVFGDMPVAACPKISAEFIDKLIIAATRTSAETPRGRQPLVRQDNGNPTIAEPSRSIAAADPYDALCLVLAHLFSDKDDLTQLWQRWTELRPKNAPWRAFRATGMDPEPLVRWAVAALEDAKRDGDGSGQRDAPDACLKTLVADGSAWDAAMVLAHVGYQHSWYRPLAANRLRELPLTANNRKLRLALCAARPQNAVLLIGDWRWERTALRPEPGEQEWRAIADGFSGGEKLGWMARAELAEPGDARWDVFLKFATELNEDVARLEPGEVYVRLHRGGAMAAEAMAEGMRRNDAQLEPVVRSLFDLAHLLPAFEGWPLFWSLASKLCGPEFVRDQLESRQTAWPGAAPERYRCMAQIGQMDVVLADLASAETRSMAAEGLLKLTPRKPRDWFSKVANALGSDAGSVVAEADPDGSSHTWKLIAAGLKQAPNVVAPWFAQLLANHPHSNATAAAVQAAAVVESRRHRSLLLRSIGW